MFVSVTDDEKDLASLFKDALSQIDGIQVFAFSDPKLTLEHFQTRSQTTKICGANISRHQKSLPLGLAIT
jgi:hypothetical protein